MSANGARIVEFYQMREGGSDMAGDALRMICHPDVRLHLPERLPFGGSVIGIDAVIERLRQSDEFLTHDGSATTDAFVDDDPMLICFSAVTWRQEAFASRGYACNSGTKTSEWWLRRDGLVQEIFFFCYDIGLISAPASTAGTEIGSWPASILANPSRVIFGQNRAGNPNQALIEKLYSDARDGIASDLEVFFHENITLFESRGLPYGQDAHRGSESTVNCIAAVVVWCDMPNVELLAVASRDDRVCVLVCSPFRDGSGQVMIVEDWHLRDGKVAWYRAYYWDTASVSRVYLELGSNDPPNLP
jgi:hypothetical protein